MMRGTVSISGTWRCSAGALWGVALLVRLALASSTRTSEDLQVEFNNTQQNLAVDPDGLSSVREGSASGQIN